MSLGKVMASAIGLLVLAGLAGAQFYQNSWSYSYPSDSVYGLGGLGGIYGSYGPFGLSGFGWPAGLGGLGSFGWPAGLGGLGGFSGLSSIYGPFGPFGMTGLGGLGGWGSPFSYNYGNSPYYSYPSGSLFDSSPSTDLFSTFGSGSPFGDVFGGSLFKAKQYGTPPEDNITKALVGQKLSYSSGYMGIPLQYQVEDGDVGDITGTQYLGADAWKVRVGQPGAYWDVIMDESGNSILSTTQIQ